MLVTIRLLRETSTCTGCCHERPLSSCFPSKSCSFLLE